MARFVLVHGAWHGGWCWEYIAPLLESAGHRVLAPDLPGMGADPTPLSAVSLARWADFIADILRGDPEPAILVGHSRGGIVISAAAERAPEHIARLVYLAAFLVPDGRCLFDLAREGPPPPRDWMTISPDKSRALVVPELVRDTFYGMTPPDCAARAEARLVPEPLPVLVTPLKLTDDRYGRVPRAYVETLYDAAIPLALQRRMQAALPCDPVITLASDHSPFYSMPAELAAQLIGLASDLR